MHSNNSTAQEATDIEQARPMARRFLAFYPTIALADPEFYIAELVTVLCRYPPDVCAAALQSASMGSPDFPPSIPRILQAMERTAIDLAPQPPVPPIPPPSPERVAIVHIWLRAQQAGAEGARERLWTFSEVEKAAARAMTLAEALELVPEARARMSKPLEAYGPLP